MAGVNVEMCSLASYRLINLSHCNHTLAEALSNMGPNLIDLLTKPIRHCHLLRSPQVEGSRYLANVVMLVF